MQIQHQLRRVAAALLTAAIAVGTGAFSGLALETDSGTLESLQAFLLGKENAGGTDCNGDGVVDGMDLALLRQQQFDGGEIQDGYAGFIRTDGKLLVDENGKQYLIKGMAIGNDVWSNPTTAPAQDHDAASYQELADMGFDSVRFYLKLRHGLNLTANPIPIGKKASAGWTPTLHGQRRQESGWC